ncbi:hypothetical protein QFZ24_000396 [Streptomyces phaeochromogenes]|nr:DsbA family protein [Streptomyces phaeochromogenes]MDQ0946473.1 hypothetical protein [Streptomyces phaeochromogenes]
MRSPRTTHTGADAAPVRGDEGGVVRLVSGPSVTGSLSRAPVRIEVWSDIQCVWCCIGHARWVKALAQVDIPTTLVHRSFALQPEAPDDFDAQTYLRAHRGLSETDQQQLFDKMKQTAAADSLAYEPSRIRPTNSRAALELLHQPHPSAGSSRYWSASTGRTSPRAGTSAVPANSSPSQPRPEWTLTMRGARWPKEATPGTSTSTGRRLERSAFAASPSPSSTTGTRSPGPRALSP